MSANKKTAQAAADPAEAPEAQDQDDQELDDQDELEQDDQDELDDQDQDELDEQGEACRVVFVRDASGKVHMQTEGCTREEATEIRERVEAQDYYLPRDTLEDDEDEPDEDDVDEPEDDDAEDA